MQLPSADDFTHETGCWVGPPWWARVPGAFLAHPLAGLSPVEFGCRVWGGDLPRWRPPFRPIDG